MSESTWTMPTARGQLFRYAYGCDAFELLSEPPLLTDRVLVVLGGMEDWLTCLPYVPRVAQRVAVGGWRTMRVTLRSAGHGFGVHSLETDAEDIDKLLESLKGRGITRVALLGHSTGCQDIVWYLRTRKALPLPVVAAILQGPASDRDHLEMTGGTAPVTAAAQDLVAQGQPDCIVAGTKAFYGKVPMSAARWISLATRLGDDDMFSEDLTAEELVAIAPPVPAGSIGCLLVSSSRDECLPPGMDHLAMCRRFAAATTAEVVQIDAPHDGTGAEEQMAGLCADFLVRCV